ncbi:glycoside hydrolase family 97 protein [Flavihumibacter profundi]|uniref:glycoside hydrolase family 97 protein n=1 Tax=Flavihumibacter profundi TaxID=2716883 RepID=UPI001CC73252|nr:glycoside hydrolase family 97 protein [Flavihumibacter profundi]MBZ5858131.1 glycoside hydrolase family 97 protein [Flavihumibacter profundi]
MRILKHPILLIVAMAIAVSVTAQEKTVMHSKNSAISLVVQNNEAGNVQYSITYNGEPVILPSGTGFVFNKPSLRLDSFETIGIDSSANDETWEPVWGEVKSIRNSYKELTYAMADKKGSGIRVNLIFRVFDDGVGFRYEFPQQEKLGHFIIGDELTGFQLTADHTAFWIPGDYDSNEYLYNTTRLSAVDATKAAAKEPDIALKSLYGPDAVQTPLLLKTDKGIYINIHEAALVNYPVMQLNLDKAHLLLSSHLVPDAAGNKAYLQTPFKTPWRTIIVSNKATDLLASKMILNLNEPSVISDPSWIKPQKFIGMWWEMHVGKATWPKAGGKHGANTGNVMKYIDFAAANGFDGVLVEGWNEGWEDWFGNWKENVFDFVTPYPDYNIDSLSAYAKKKGVRLIMHHETSGSVTNYERHMDTAYRFMLEHGINTVKTGYVGRIIPRGEYHDGQWMVNHFQRVTDKTAHYKIMVDSHESVRPTGLHRTYPNWLASEAARGNEFNNAPALGLRPEHETILPFTRLMGGPMDYTPGYFHFQLNQFDSTRKTRIRTTLAKQLALFVTMYSPLQMAGDLPENYEQFPDAFQFIKDVPVDWDDTKILSAEPGDYVVIARKAKGRADWFAGAVTDENSRSVEFDFNFLDPGYNYQAIIYKDAENANWETNPAAYAIEKKTVTNKTKLSVKLAKGGGAAIALTRLASQGKRR